MEPTFTFKDKHYQVFVYSNRIELLHVDILGFPDSGTVLPIRNIVKIDFGMKQEPVVTMNGNNAFVIHVEGKDAEAFVAAMMPLL